jgi:hypothetical protein
VFTLFTLVCRVALRAPRNDASFYSVTSSQRNEDLGSFTIINPGLPRRASRSSQ